MGIQSYIPATSHLLHFEDLSPDDFERIVYCLVVRTDDFIRVEYFGGSSDKGRDVVAYKTTDNAEEKWYFQCKRYDQIHFSTLKGELDKLAEHSKKDPHFSPDRIVFATSCTVSPSAKDKAASYAYKLNLPEPFFWGRIELDERIKREPGCLKEFFNMTYDPSRRPNYLRPPLQDFTGRQKDVEQLISLLARDKKNIVGIHIVGMGGVGKSSLAVYVANRLADKYPDGQIEVNMRGTSDLPLNPVEAMGQIIHAFYPEASLPENPDQIKNFYHDTLANRKALILLDDAARAKVIRSLIPPSSCCLIITSRRKIKVAGIELYPIGGFDKQDAIHFLQNILGKDRGTYKELETIAELCGRLPLALRVAGNFLAVHEDWTVTEYIDVLRDERKRLARLRHEDLDVKAVLGVSVMKLSQEFPAMVLKWQILSIFPASFHRAAAAVVWKVDEDDARDILGTLLERFLVLFDLKSNRYYLHDLMRVFANNLLKEKEVSRKEDQEACLRAAEWYGEKSSTIRKILTPETFNEKTSDNISGSAQAQESVNQPLTIQEALNWYEIEHPNLMAAIEWAYGSKKWNLVQHLNKNMVTFFNIRGYWTDLEKTLSSALDAAHKNNDQFGQGISQCLLGNVYRSQGRYDKARQMLETALGTFDEMKSLYGRCMASNLLANVYRIQGSWDEAFKMFSHSLKLNRQRDNRNKLFGEAIALGGLGNIHRMRGEWSEALEKYGKSIQINRQLEDLFGESIALNNIALVYCKQNRLEDAAHILERSLTIGKELRNLRGISIAQRTMGEVLTHQGKYAEAVDMIEESLKFAYELGDLRVQVQSLNCLGEAYIQQGLWDKAQQCFNQALAVLEKLDDQHGEGLTLRNIGILRRKQGKPEEAREIWRKALSRLHKDSPEYKSVEKWLNK